MASAPSSCVAALSLVAAIITLSLTACSSSDAEQQDPAAEVPDGSSGSSGQAGSSGEVLAGSSGEGGSSQAPKSPFITRVVSFTPGPKATFGQDRMPDIVLGPPVGGGSWQGSLDVVSLGVDGEIVVGFDQDITDGPGTDFLVFENPFFAGGDSNNVFAEIGEVSVSEDGETWATFFCDPEDFRSTLCAGWHPVYSTPDNGISPLDPEVAGGDPFDLADVGLSRARFVKIRSRKGQQLAPSAGFDLDAIAIVHGEP